MKENKFLIPEAEIVEFNNEDAILTSTNVLDVDDENVIGG